MTSSPSALRGARLVVFLAAVVVVALSAARRDWGNAAFWALFGATYLVLPMRGATTPGFRWRRPLGFVMVGALLVLSVLRLVALFARQR
jgi:hypothetical protein